MGRSETHFSEMDHYGTPEKIWGPLVEQFGTFALDPMTNHRSRIPAIERWTDWTLTAAQERHYQLRQRNAFQHNWHGRFGLVFCNGPFSLLTAWVTYAHEQHALGSLESCLLVPVRTTGSAWQAYLFAHWHVCWLNFRVHFDGAKDSAPFHCALCYRGCRPVLFHQAVQGLGRIQPPGAAK